MVAEWLARKSKDELTITRIRIVSRNIFSFGLAGKLSGESGLLSANLIQAGIFQSVWCWVVLLLLMGLHIAEFRELEGARRRLLLNIYYSAVLVWYIGIIVDYLL